MSFFDLDNVHLEEQGFKTNTNNDDGVKTWNVALQILLPVAALAIFWGRRGLITKFFMQFDKNYISAFCPSFSKRERLLKWASGRLHPSWFLSHNTSLPYSPAEFWNDGSLLCTLINSAIPGACSNPHRHWQKPPSHGQALAYKYLGVIPVFPEPDLNERTLTGHQEQLLIQYLTELQQAINKISQNELKFSSNYIARGMGLVTGEQNRKAFFYIYPNANSQSSTTHDIMISIRGPYNSHATITVPSSCVFRKTYQKSLYERRRLAYESKAQKLFFRSLSIDFSSYIHGNHHKDHNNIPVKLYTEKDRMKVAYIPKHTGIHEVSIITNGCHLLGSPFSTCVMGSSTEVVEDFLESEGVASNAGGLKSVRRKIIAKMIDFVDEQISYEHLKSLHGSRKLAASDRSLHASNISKKNVASNMSAVFGERESSEKTESSGEIDTSEKSKAFWKAKASEMVKTIEMEKASEMSKAFVKAEVAEKAEVFRKDKLSGEAKVNSEVTGKTEAVENIIVARNAEIAGNSKLSKIAENSAALQGLDTLEDLEALGRTAVLEQTRVLECSKVAKSATYPENSNNLHIGLKRFEKLISENSDDNHQPLDTSTVCVQHTELQEVDQKAVPKNVSSKNALFEDSAFKDSSISKDGNCTIPASKDKNYADHSPQNGNFSEKNNLNHVAPEDSNSQDIILEGLINNKNLVSLGNNSILQKTIPKTLLTHDTASNSSSSGTTSTLPDPRTRRTPFQKQPNLKLSANFEELEDLQEYEVLTQELAEIERSSTPTSTEQNRNIEEEFEKLFESQWESEGTEDAEIDFEIIEPKASITKSVQVRDDDREQLPNWKNRQETLFLETNNNSPIVPQMEKICLGGDTNIPVSKDDAINSKSLLYQHSKNLLMQDTKTSPAEVSKASLLQESKDLATQNFSTTQARNSKQQSSNLQYFKPPGTRDVASKILEPKSQELDHEKLSTRKLSRQSEVLEAQLPESHKLNILNYLSSLKSGEAEVGIDVSYQSLTEDSDLDNVNVRERLKYWESQTNLETTPRARPRLRSLPNLLPDNSNFGFNLNSSLHFGSSSILRSNSNFHSNSVQNFSSKSNSASNFKPLFEQRRQYWQSFSSSQNLNCSSINGSLFYLENILHDSNRVRMRNSRRSLPDLFSKISRDEVFRKIAYDFPIDFLNSPDAFKFKTKFKERREFWEKLSNSNNYPSCYFTDTESCLEANSEENFDSGFGSLWAKASNEVLVEDSGNFKDEYKKRRRYWEQLSTSHEVADFPTKPKLPSKESRTSLESIYHARIDSSKTVSRETNFKDLEVEDPVVVNLTDDFKYIQDQKGKSKKQFSQAREFFKSLEGNFKAK